MKYTSDHIRVGNSVKYTPVFRGCTGQDGAIYADMLFRFDSDGTCKVFSLKTHEMISRFTLDKADIIKPHSNSVSFGSGKYAPDDEFPLLYTNIYNNYARAEDRLEGACCVYRIMRSGDGFSTKLVQVIRVGFVNDIAMWKSLPDRGDVRPYGNMVADAHAGRMYAFTMRDAEHVTRIFEFALPEVSAGEYSDRWGVNVVTLEKQDILSYFDAEYTNYMQGACAYDGRIYSVEGFNVKSPDDANRPAIRVFDVQARKQLAHVDLYEAGLDIEPELIDFNGDILYYMDASGAVYVFEFE